MAMPKKAPYKPSFDRVVRRVVEAGLVRKTTGLLENIAHSTTRNFMQHHSLPFIAITSLITVHLKK